jgi:hypothetical protein
MATSNLTFPEARRKLDQLLERRELLVFQGTNTYGTIDQTTQLRIKPLDDEIRILQEFCNIKLMESNTQLLDFIKELLRSLRSESRKLTWLTGGLIATSVVLAILTALSVYKQFI